MPQNKIKVGTVIAIVLALVIFAAACAGAYYCYEENQKVVAQEQQIRAEIDTIKMKLAQYQDLEAEMARLDEEMSRLDAFVPSKEEQAAFVKEIEAIADATSTIIVDTTMEKTTKEVPNLPQYVIFQWKVNIEAPYASVLEFLDSMNTTSRLVKVSDIKVVAMESKARDDKKARNPKDGALKATVVLDLISSVKKVKS